VREPWRIVLLGGLRAERAGLRHERFRTRKTAALLGLLALAPGRRHARDALCRLLWPDLAPEGARNGLSKALSSLRAQLEPPGVTTGEVLGADRENVWLEAEAISTDRAALEAHLRAGRPEEALALFAGELLPGHDWEGLPSARARLQETARDAALSLAQERAAADPGTALRFARRAAEIDPLHEGAHRMVMRLLAQAGEPLAAAREYGALERRLEEELGARPSVVTQALARGLAAPVTAPKPHTATTSTNFTSATPTPAPAPAPAPAPLRRLAGLPRELSRFVGREEELGRLHDLLSAGAHRLVTITGPGGIGKTRLAMEAARRAASALEGGAVLLGLADLAHARLVPEALLAALGLEARPDKEPTPRLVLALSRAPALLLLDNAEHLLPQGEALDAEGATGDQAASLPGLVRTLLEGAPTLRCLVTSRRPLGLTGEREEPLAPLDVPPAEAATPAALLPFASVRLFVERARRARPRFDLDALSAADVGALVRRLEGIPLAIALAAGRSHALTPREILLRLEDARLLDLPAARERDVAPRHRTLRAAIDASHALLSPPQARLLSRLSVFRGGFTLAAAEEVCQEPLALDLLCDLRECSLVLSQDDGRTTRFRMLETIREYAAERLSAEERAPLLARHAAWALALAEALGPRTRTGDAEASARLTTEHENLRAALDVLSQGGDAEALLAARLAAALAPFWDVRGHWREAEARLGAALARVTGPLPERSALLRQAGNLARRRGDLAAARALLTECVAIERSLGSRPALSGALGSLGAVLISQGDREGARPLIEESAALAGDDPARRGQALLQLGVMAHADGDLERARDRFSVAADALALAGDRANAAFAGVNAAAVLAQAGRLEEARVRMERALEVFRALGNEPGIAGALLRYGEALREAGSKGPARAALEDALARHERLGARQEAAYARIFLGALTADEGRPREGRALAEEGLREMRAIGQARGMATAEAILAKIANPAGETSNA